MQEGIRQVCDTCCRMQHGTKDIRVNEHRRMPLITDPGDALIKVTATCICGSDLHMYNGVFPGMRKGALIWRCWLATYNTTPCCNVQAGCRGSGCQRVARQHHVLCLAGTGNELQRVILSACVVLDVRGLLLTAVRGASYPREFFECYS